MVFRCVSLYKLCLDAGIYYTNIYVNFYHKDDRIFSGIWKAPSGISYIIFVYGFLVFYKTKFWIYQQNVLLRYIRFAFIYIFRFGFFFFVHSYSGSISCKFFILRIFKTKWNTLWWICFSVTQFNIFTTVQWKHMLHKDCQILNEKWLKKDNKEIQKLRKGIWAMHIDCHENLFMKNVMSLTRNVGSLFSVFFI